MTYDRRYGFEQGDEGAAFAAELKKRWRNVKYDPRRQVGKASMGAFDIEFSPSQNDRAVWIEIKNVRRIKSFHDPKETAKILDQIGRTLSMKF